MEDRVAGERPGETGDLRLVEEGLEEEAETAVAGVTGAEAWLVEPHEVSLRESEKSSVGSAAAPESLRLLRGADAADLAAFERRDGLVPIGLSAVDEDAAVVEESVERLPEAEPAAVV